MTLARLRPLAGALLSALTSTGAPVEARICSATVAASPGFAGPTSPLGDRFWFGSDALAVLLNSSGTWSGMGPSHGHRDKLFWWRKGYDGVAEPRPALVVSGRRLDGEASPARVSEATNARHEDLGGWTMLVGVEFPTGGCWEVTGEYHGQEVRFVVQVGP